MPELKGQCYSCVNPNPVGATPNFYCPSTGNCHNNYTVENPNNYLLNCTNATFYNQTDQCMADPIF